MKKYKASIRGENFLLNLEGELRKYGFFTTRFVEARYKEEVKSKVTALLCNDSALAEAFYNQSSDAPIIYVEEVVELGWFGMFKSQGSGFTFYPEATAEEDKSS